MIPVLLIDDDRELTVMLSRYLAHEGFAATSVHDGEAGVVEALSGRHALVVLDVMMPRFSGMEALRRIRARTDVPVLMLTARGDNIDRIVGLDMGADDYIPKPCTPGELLARMRAVLRRVATRRPEASHAPAALLEAGALQLWPGTRQAQLNGVSLSLTGTEFSILEVLTRHAGVLISKDAISLQAFGEPLTRFDRRIDVHISSVRQKLGQRPDGQPWITSVRGKGYQLLLG
jgi:two-component system OmpR family response regulator